MTGPLPTAARYRDADRAGRACRLVDAKPSYKPGSRRVDRPARSVPVSPVEIKRNARGTQTDVMNCYGAKADAWSWN